MPFADFGRKVEDKFKDEIALLKTKGEKLFEWDQSKGLFCPLDRGFINFSKWDESIIKNVGTFEPTCLPRFPLGSARSG